MTLNLEKENLKIFLRSGLYGLLLAAPFYLILFTKGCNENIQKPNLHGARMFFPIDVDTTRKTVFINGGGTYTTMIVNKYRSSVYDKWEYDTTYPPRPKPINQLYLRKIDTLNAIGQNYLGRAMTVDNYIYWNGIFTRILLELRNDTTLTHGK